MPNTETPQGTPPKREHVYKSGAASGRPRPGTAQAGAARAAEKENGGGKAAGLKGRFTQKQLRTNILIGSLILVLILALVLAALLPGCLQTEAPVSSSSTSMYCASVLEANSGYDKDALAIPPGKYDDTIIPEGPEVSKQYTEDTLFLGDSNTARMLLFRDVTGVSMANGIGIESMGITSVLGLKCVRFSGMADCTMPQAVKIMQPRRVVINFGTNNAGMNVDSFITSYKNVCKAIEESWPYADIIIASVFPITQSCTYGNVSQKGIDAFNLALVEMAQDEGYKFLNWSDAIKDEATGYCQAGRMDRDGVHLNATGMEEIFSYFRTHGYETEDTRPKPLKAIPTRLPTPEGLFPKPASSTTGASSSDTSFAESSSSSAAPSKSQAPVVSTPPVSVPPEEPTPPSSTPVTSSAPVVSSTPEEVVSPPTEGDPGGEGEGE